MVIMIVTREVYLLESIRNSCIEIKQEVYIYCRFREMMTLNADECKWIFISEKYF